MTINTLNLRKNSTHLHPIKYRADIDGLRAIAVLLVVIFHAFPSILKGGFIGVDIFFIISGYLITTILLNALKNDHFSLIEFYNRRIKRIFPALLIVLCTSYLVGWFFLLGEEYKQLGKHIAGGAGFISNFMLWGESGYFDNIAESKPLLHLWSLGIEEQFYIVWPLILCFVWKKRLNLLAITLLLITISFILNIVKAGHEPIAAFYSPQTRFWELLSGSALSYIILYSEYFLLNPTKNNFITLLSKISFIGMLKNNKKRLINAISIIGIIFLVLGTIIINKDKHFPGWWALLPIIGTVLIIASGSQAWINQTILSNKIMVWIGLISFPLYLWHWPILSFARIIESEIPSVSIRAFAILLSILLAWLTYMLVERPIRFGKNNQLISIALLFLMMMTGSLGYHCFKFDGFSFRFKEKQDFADYFENSPPTLNFNQTIGLFHKFRLECDFYDLNKYLAGKGTRIPLARIHKTCFTRNHHYKKSLFIWGDSHAQQLNYGIKKNLPKNWQILQVASSSCNPDLSAKKSSTIDYCKQSNWFALKTIKETKPDVVIIAQNNNHNIEQFNSITKALKKTGVKKIIIMGPTPHWTSDLPKIILTKLWKNTPKRTYQFVDKQIIKENALLQKEYQYSKNQMYVNLINLFCNHEGCLTFLGKNKKTGITSFDYGHLTPVASDYLAKNVLVKLITDTTDEV